MQSRRRLTYHENNEQGQGSADGDPDIHARHTDSEVFETRETDFGNLDDVGVAGKRVHTKDIDL